MKKYNFIMSLLIASVLLLTCILPIPVSYAESLYAKMSSELLSAFESIDNGKNDRKRSAGS